MAISLPEEGQPLEFSRDRGMRAVEVGCGTRPPPTPLGGKSSVRGFSVRGSRSVSVHELEHPNQFKPVQGGAAGRIQPAGGHGIGARGMVRAWGTDAKN